MDDVVLIERDILYPTDNTIEPGCVNIKVFGPNKDNRIPVVIEEKTANSPLKHIATITRIMQDELFDRIFIDIRRDADIYIQADAHLSMEFGNHPYIKVNLVDEKVSAEGVELLI